MDIPRGHAMLPLVEGDFLDFVYNYFKAEYSPIRSFWSTATAEPRQPPRWIAMGHEMSPLGFRSANAQAQKDLESLEFFIRKWGLDAGFVRGLVIRFAKYEIHERLEKRLYESCRLDLMVRKALKEKHLIDALWPSPAPRNIHRELLQQGVQVRRWYGDMFAKYYKHLRAADDFALRPEVDQKIKCSTTLVLVPFADHLTFGTVDPIIPIVAMGQGYSVANAKKAKEIGAGTFGAPDQFEVRFDAPAEAQETYTRTVTRQCQCLKCGSKRDVKVVISIDPTPRPTLLSNTDKKASNSANSASKRHTSKTAQKYSPGYNMPGKAEGESLQPQPPRSNALPSISNARPPSPEKKKQCPRCTFLNHPELTTCEICQGELPETLTARVPSPTHEGQTASRTTYEHSTPVPQRSRNKDSKIPERPTAPNRNSLSQSLFSIFPFPQQHQSGHNVESPATKLPETLATANHKPSKTSKDAEAQPRMGEQQVSYLSTKETPESSHGQPSSPPYLGEDPTNSEPQYSNHPVMTMMPLTPPAKSSRAAPDGLPQTLMDDYVPVSPPTFTRDEEDAGWGEMSREEARRADESSDQDVGRLSGEGLVDLDAVAREEMGVWGEREDE